MPRGAFYVFPNITGTGLGSQACEDLLLNKAGVATLSGASFGATGEGYLRLSYANSVENIEKAIERMRDDSGAHLAEIRALAVDLGLEHADKGEVAIRLGVIQAIADHELIGDLKPDIVHVQIRPDGARTC